MEQKFNEVNVFEAVDKTGRSDCEKATESGRSGKVLAGATGMETRAALGCLSGGCYGEYRDNHALKV